MNIIYRAILLGLLFGFSILIYAAGVGTIGLFLMGISIAWGFWEGVKLFRKEG